MAYRLIVALYFFGWLVVSGEASGGPSYLIFLTNWGFVTYNIYTIIAAASTLTKYITVHFISPPSPHEFSRSREFEVKKPSGCCGYSDNKLSWYQMIHWVFFILGTEVAVLVMLLYWILLYTGSSVDGINANTHLVNGLVAIIDLLITGVPIRILHVIYPLIFGTAYSIFVGIYFVASGESVYGRITDFENNPGGAVGILVAVVLVVVPLVHMVVFYLPYLARYWILYCIFNRRDATSESEQREMKEDFDRKDSVASTGSAARENLA